MSLWRRPSGMYESHICVDGIRHRRSTGTSNRRLAQQIDRKLADELLAQRFQVVEKYNPTMKFGELVTNFAAEETVKPWQSDRLKILLPYFFAFEIAQINKNAVKQYRAFRHKQRKLTETTINRDLECLRHILYWATEQGILPGNPLARLKLERGRRKKRPIMSLEEERKLLAAAAIHLRGIIICALDSGLRRGEILTQCWQDIDFSRRVLAVTHSKTPEGESREIPLTKRLFELLSKERRVEGLIFTYHDRPISRIKTAWKAAVRRAGIKFYRFKDLRATFNSRLIEAGVIKDVRKELMGHSRNEDTNDLYSHIELPVLREAIAKLEQWRHTETRKEEELKTETEMPEPAASPAAQTTDESGTPKLTEPETPKEDLTL